MTVKVKDNDISGLLNVGWLQFLITTFVNDDLYLQPDKIRYSLKQKNPKMFSIDHKIGYIYLVKDLKKQKQKSYSVSGCIDIKHICNK